MTVAESVFAKWEHDGLVEDRIYLGGWELSQMQHQRSIAR